MYVDQDDIRPHTTFDRDGNLYFNPLFPGEEVILVSLDPDTGTRRWDIEGFSYGGGAPLVLDDRERSPARHARRRPRGPRDRFR